MWSRRLRRFRTYGPELILDVLEDRIVLDASVAPAAQDQHDNGANATTVDQAAQAQTGATDAVAANASGGNGDASGSHSDSSSSQAAQVLSQDLKVILVSNALDHLDTITQAAKENAQVIVMDPLKDNLGTVEAKLDNLVQSTGQKIGTLAVVAHGTSGAVEIGADSISIDNFFKYEAGFQTLSKILTDGAQIQFYGCSVAEGSSGSDLLGKISSATHADVFASLDNTGSQNNNWNLEYSTDPGTPMYVLLDQAKLGDFNEVLSFRGVWPLSDPNQYYTYWGAVDASDPMAIDGRRGEYWTFYGTVGEFVSIGMQTTRPSLGYNNALNLDCFLEIWNPDGTQAAQLDDWKSPPGTGDDPPYSLYSDVILQWYLPETGWYVVEATQWNLDDYADYSLICTKELTAMAGNNVQNKVFYRDVPDVSTDNDFTNYTYDMADFFGKPPGTTPDATFSLTSVTGTLGAGTYTCVVDPTTGLITFTHTGTGSGYLDVAVRLTDGSTTANDTFRLNVTAGNAAPYSENGGLPDLNVWPGDSLTTIIDLKSYFHDWEDGDNLVFDNPQPAITGDTGVIDSWTLDTVNGLLTLNYSSTGQGTATVAVTGRDSGGLTLVDSFDVTARLDEPFLQNLGFETGNTNGWNIDATPVTVIASGTAGGGFDNYVVQVDRDGGDASPAQLTQGFRWQGEQIQVGYDFFTYDGLGYDHFGYTISVNGESKAYVNRDAGWSGNPDRGTYATSGWIYEPTINLADFGAEMGDVIDIRLFAGNDVTSGNYDSWAYFDLQAIISQDPVSKGIANIEVMEDSADTVINLWNAFYDPQTPASLMTYKYTITNTGTDNTDLFAHLDGATPVLDTPTTITNPGAFALDYGANESGYANIIITATDSDSHSVDYTFKVTVRPVNDRPTGTDLTLMVESGQYLDVTLTGNDPEQFAASAVDFVTNYGGTGTFVAVGALQDLGSGNYSQVWRYTPNANHYGNEAFDYSPSTPTGTWNGFLYNQGTIIGDSGDRYGTRDMQMADLNHDGYLDLVTANRTSNGGTQANYFYLNNGAGNFNDAVRMGSDTERSMRVVLGDIDGDADAAGNPWLDAVVVNAGNDRYDYYYTWIPGDNDFSNGTQLPGTDDYVTTAVAMGDVDGDGDQDIVIATNETTDRVIIFKNNGSGTFTEGPALQSVPGGIGAIGIADMNGDGYVDIVVGKDNTASDVIYVNNGSGSFTRVIYLPSAGQGTTQYLALGDVDGDGKVDIVMGDNGLNRFYKNNGGLSFSYFPIGTESEDTTSIRLADLDKDGYLDVVAFNDYGTTAQPNRYYIYNTADANPYGHSGTPIENPAIRCEAGVLGDVNNDGNVDLIMGILTTSGNSVGTINDRLMLNQGFADSTVAQSPDPGNVIVHTELIHNWGFETGDLGTNAWQIDERTTEDDPTLLALVGVVTNNTTVDMTTNMGGPVTVQDMYDGDYPWQFWALVGANPLDPWPSITVNDPTGAAGDNILLSVDNGPRKDMIYQDITIPNDPSVTQYTVTWRMSYWNLDFINHDPHFYDASSTQPQYIALYVYDPTEATPAPVWITTEGVDNDTVSQLQDYSVTITDSALRGTTVRVALEVFSGDNFLHVAVDDFHIYPTRTAVSTPSAGTVNTGNPPYYGEPTYLQPPSGMTATAEPPSLLTDPVGVQTFSSTMFLDETDPDLLLTLLSSSSGTSGPTVVQTLESLSSGSSPTLVTVLEQQAAQTYGTTTTWDQGTTSFTQTQPYSIETGAGTGTGSSLPWDVQQPPSGSGTTTQSSDTQAGPDTETPADTTAPDTDTTQAATFGPDLDLMTTLVFDRNDVSAMQVLAATTMDAFPENAPDLPALYAKLGGGQSVTVSLNAVKLTEIFG